MAGAWMKHISSTLSVLACTVCAIACTPPRNDRVVVPSSDPRVACSLTEGPRSSPDAASAIAHAKDAFASVYEKTHSSEASPANLAKFEPFAATLKDGVWHVQGTVPPEYFGPVPVASVCKNDEGATLTWLKMPHILVHTVKNPEAVFSTGSRRIERQRNAWL
jgi:hypothetical protein